MTAAEDSHALASQLGLADTVVDEGASAAINQSSSVLPSVGNKDPWLETAPRQAPPRFPINRSVIVFLALLVVTSVQPMPTMHSLIRDTQPQLVR